MMAIRGFEVELDREDDGRVIAEWTGLPGVVAYGTDEEEAVGSLLSFLPVRPSESPSARRPGDVGVVFLLSEGEVGPRLLDRLASRIPPLRS